MSNYGLADDTEQIEQKAARILVLGVGGGGGNAVENMVRQEIQGLDFLCANTDRQALDTLSVPKKFQLGTQINRGLGAGGNPEIGQATAESDENELRDILQGYDMIFITAGMGGGTGTGAAPVIARIASELDILTVAVVTTPFKFEGGQRAKAAKDGIEQLSSYVNSIITIPNEKLQSVYRNISTKDAFKKADDVLLYGVQGLIEAIRRPGQINIDFNDIRTVMGEKGYAMMGLGRSSGDDRATSATEKAIRSPLLDDLRLENAKAILINITAKEIMMSETDEIAATVESIIDMDSTKIFYGIVNDDSMNDDIQVTVIATGLTLDERPKVMPRPTTQSQKTLDPSHVSALQQQVAQPAQASRPQTNDRTPMDVSSYLKKRIS